MKHPVRRRLAAQDSLERIAIQIAEHDLEAATRFVDAVEASLALLSEMPEAGPRYETEDAARLQDAFGSGSFLVTGGICSSTSSRGASYT